MHINAQFAQTTENKVGLQHDANSPSPRPNDSITFYTRGKAYAIIFLSWFCIGPGIVKVTDVFHKTIYLNKTEFKKWIDSKLKHVTHIDGTDEQSVTEALRLILNPISQIGQVALADEKVQETGLEFLKEQISKFERSQNPNLQHLATLYQTGLDTYEFKCKQRGLIDTSIECYSLPDDILKEFDFTAPIYLRETMQLDLYPGSPEMRYNFYDYLQPRPEEEERYFVNFASKNLGGVDGELFPEQIMLIEAPVLVDLKERKKNEGKPIVLRTPNANTHPKSSDRTDGPGNGNPAPLLVKNVLRLGIVESSGQEDLREQSARFLPLEDPQKINMLAMAAPRIRNDKEKYDKDTIRDLFNTFVAGFRLAKEDALKNGKRCVICTGKIGCGAFGNDLSVVYALQALAAKYVGVDKVIMHEYDDTERTRGENLWQAISEKFAHAPTSLGEILESIPALAETCAKKQG